jgi:hypothetical protein
MAKQPLRSRRYFRLALLLLSLIAAVVPVRAQDIRASKTTMSAAELFDFAERAKLAGDFPTAEIAYRALTENPDIELRTEARFRLALMLADEMAKPREAAVLLRQILDEKPDAARVRIELARLQAQLGNFASAERELRAAEASGLPPEVEQMVRFYASALSSQRRVGFNVEVALAPDSNVNRATRSETLGTIIGDFDLSKDARARSGIGLSAQAQLWGRIGVVKNMNLLTRVSGSGDFYRRSAFDDHAVSIDIGPEVVSKADHIRVAAVTSWRWFGGRPYSFSYGANANYQHPLAGRTKLRLDASAVRSDDKLNSLRNADRLALAAGLDHAFSARLGGGMLVRGQREIANDSAYSTAGVGVNGYLFREFGRTTVVASFGYNHLEADKRLFLYPRRRADDRLTAGISATFRSLRVGRFAPIVRLDYERNISSVEIYDYRRVASEIGITAAF